MSDQEIRDAAPQQDERELIDLDDVEGHGLREVAAGLGAAAVLAGGASAAAVASGPHLPLPSVHPSGASITVQDPMGTVDRATDEALQTARSARDAALAGATSTADRAVARADAAVTGAEGTVGTLGSAVRHDAAAVTGYAGAVVNQTAGTATGTVSSTRATADSTVADTTTDAGTAVRQADRKVATILNVTVTTAADGVRTTTATLRAVNAGAGVDVATAGGWVLVKAGDAVLAQVHMSGGSATASWTVPVIGSEGVSVTYTGDDVFAPAVRPLVV